MSHLPPRLPATSLLGSQLLCWVSSPRPHRVAHCPWLWPMWVSGGQSWREGTSLPSENLHGP